MAPVWQAGRRLYAHRIGRHDRAGRLMGPAALIAMERLVDGQFAAVGADLDNDMEPLILYRDGEQVRAWVNVCPHAGRQLDWAPGQFLKSKDGLLVCAVHGASFELQRGECVAGPCRGDSLRAVAVEVRDGAVWLKNDDAGV